MELCPVCKSKRIISARHDCDWGGGNSLGAVNPKEHYNEYDLDENEDVENFGDIDIRVCLECDFTWQRYTDPVKILRKYLEVQKKSSKAWSCIYSLESITDFYADDDFEDAIREVIGDNSDLSQRIRITVELVK